MGAMSEHALNTAELSADMVCARLATGDCSDEAIWAAIRDLTCPYEMRELIFETITMRRAN